ncbi:MAG: type I-E CRISPR-associated protein Cse2/CasB [Armatimonadetes bacterium]|nr:type I-E CRISPR-associated protein Cse2/CasB [Armatimonadota bacterium]
MTVAPEKPQEKSAEDRLARPYAFLEDVKALDPGQLAALRRNAGATLADSHGVLWMYRLLQRHAYERDFDIYFFTATLLALDKTALKAKAFADGGDLGWSLAKFTQKFSPKALERRFSVLLDSRFDSGEMSFRMPQVVKMLTTNDIPVNWPLLLQDLLFWEAPQKHVQKRWAAHFFDPTGEAAEPEANPSSETE